MTDVALMDIQRPPRFNKPRVNYGQDRVGKLAGTDIETLTLKLRAKLLRLNNYCGNLTGRKFVTFPHFENN